jgi:hypothetical protein
VPGERFGVIEGLSGRREYWRWSLGAESAAIRLVVSGHLGPERHRQLLQAITAAGSRLVDVVGGGDLMRDRRGVALPA